MARLYDFKALTLRGDEISLKQFQDKVVLVVNTASKCGFTPQYLGLESLYQKYGELGLVVLGFPCNQFGNQEPGDAEAIAQVCQVNYGVTFPMFGKIDVNGPEAHPLFSWLTESLPGFPGRSVKWNFTKFLVSDRGKPIKRFAPAATPESLEPAIRKALGIKDEK